MKKESVPGAEGVRVEQSPKQLLGALRIWSGEEAPGARLDGEGTKKKLLREPKEMDEEGSWMPGQGKGPRPQVELRNLAQNNNKNLSCSVSLR